MSPKCPRSREALMDVVPDRPPMALGARSVVFSLGFFALGVILLVVAVGFGISYDDSHLGDEPSDVVRRLDYAAWASLALSLAAQFACAVVLLKAGVLSKARLHWAAKLIALFMASAVCCYAGLLLLLNFGSNIIGFRTLYDVTSDFILRLMP